MIKSDCDTKLLIVDDDEDDILLFKEILHEIKTVSYCVDAQTTIEGLQEKLLSNEYDIAFIDYKLGGKYGTDVIEEARVNGVNIPIVLITGLGQYEVDILAMRSGATDYIPKNELNASMVERIIRYSIHRNVLEKEREDALISLTASEERYRLLFMNMRAGFAYLEIIFDENNEPVDYIILEANEAFEDYIKKPFAEVVGRRVTESLKGYEDAEEDIIGIYASVATSGESIHLEFHKQKDNRWYSVFAYSPEEGFVAIILEDISEHKEIEMQRIREEEKLRKDLEDKKRGLKKAQELQRNLNTYSLPVFKSSVFSAYYHPSDEIGGDFFNIIKRDDKVAIIMADCTGHGIEAAMDATLIKAVVDRHIDLLYQENATDIFLEKVNNELCNYITSASYPTMFVAVLDETENNIYYSNANGVLPFYKDEDTVKQFRPTEGFHLGFSKDTRFVRGVKNLKEGEIIVICSDALTEYPIENDSTLGNSGVVACVKMFNGDFDANIELTFEQIKKYGGKTPAEDDLTIIQLAIVSPFRRDFNLASLNDMKKIEQEIIRVMKGRYYSMSECLSVSLAFHELAANAVEHGKASEKDALVSLNIDCAMSRFSIVDNGDGFSPNDVADPTDISRLTRLLKSGDEKSLTRGRGIFLAKHYMDNIEYENNGRTVHAFKSRSNTKASFVYTENSAE